MISCKEKLFELKTSTLPGSDISVADNLETIDLGLDLLKLADILEPGFSRRRGTFLLSKC
jgi:hypothetical protein